MSGLKGVYLKCKQSICSGTCQTQYAEVRIQCDGNDVTEGIKLEIAPVRTCPCRGLG